MTCGNCGNELMKADTLCPQCGHAVNQTAIIAAEEQVPSDLLQQECLSVYVGEKYPYYAKKWTRAETKNGGSPDPPHQPCISFLQFILLDFAV